MDLKDYLYRGWDFAAKLAGVDYAADFAHNYVTDVNKAILKMEEDVRKRACNKTDAALGGDLAEVWHARTFDIDAIADRSNIRADVPRSTEYASPDIRLSDGKEYSLKYYHSTEESIKQQSLLNTETKMPKYHNQERLIPSDQYADNATERAKTLARYHKNNRPEVSDSYTKTSEKLADRVTDSRHHESRPLSKRDSLDMAKKIKRDEFKAEDYDITLETVIKPEYITRRAMEAGMSAAAITMSMKLVPEIVKTIDYLARNGELDFEQLKAGGKTVITSGGEAFLRGSVACTVQILCEQGMLGKALINVNPSVVGAIVTVVLQTAKNSILVAAGKMTAREMGGAFIDGAVTSVGFIVSMEIGKKIGGVIGQTLIELPGLGYAIGSLLGCACAVMYQVSKKQLISFCVDTGFTCFGLVEQDYQLPDAVLQEAGIDIAKIEYVYLDNTEIDRASEIETVELDKASYETANLRIIKRGIIGVNKVGFVV